ncbi:MAG: hypothetical protein WBM02_02875 [bacterium]
MSIKLMTMKLRMSPFRFVKVFLIRSDTIGKGMEMNVSCESHDILLFYTI